MIPLSCQAGLAHQRATNNGNRYRGPGGGSWTRPAHPPVHLAENQLIAAARNHVSSAGAGPAERFAPPAPNNPKTPARAEAPLRPGEQLAATPTAHPHQHPSTPVGHHITASQPRPRNQPQPAEMSFSVASSMNAGPNRVTFRIRTGRGDSFLTCQVLPRSVLVSTTPRGRKNHNSSEHTMETPPPAMSSISCFYRPQHAPKRSEAQAPTSRPTLGSWLPPGSPSAPRNGEQPTTTEREPEGVRSAAGTEQDAPYILTVG